MNLFKGLGKAGTDVLGGVTKGVGKVVETVGDVAEKAPVVGGVGTVVEGAGKAIEEAGEATEDFGEKAFENKENKPKKGLKEVILGQMEEDYGRDDGPMEEDDDADEDHYKGGQDYNRDELYKQYEAEMERRAKGHDFVDDDEIDEAEEKLMKDDDDGGAVLEDSDDGEESAEIIPKYFSLKSMHNNKYLRYISESEDSDGLLRYSSKNIVGPYSKFAVRASKTERGFFHIRCCYNNKFWARKSEDSKYIAAVANEEEDDQSKLSCTLFEPIFVPEKNGHYFRHVQLNTFLCLADGDPAPYNDCLAATVEDLTTIDEKLVLFAAVDWESIFILPKYVSFKSNNGEYLEPSGKYLKFSASNVEDPAVAFEVISMQDGYVRLKHVKSGKYWIRDPNWIWCESINTEKDNPNTLFWPVKVDNNVVAFRNKGNNHFCKRLTADGKTNCLNAAVATITDTARLEVTEVVIARSVEDVEYRVNDARIYGKKVVTVSNGIAINNTEVDDKVTLKFRYQEKVERTWSTSVSSTFGIATKFTSKIPTVGSLKFELSLEVSKGSTREETETEKSFVESAETITIPRMSKVKFSAMVTTASCDVPFSYTRRDTLKDGRQVTHRLEDGIFTGVSTYDYKFETEKLSL